jgi:hypothetical protein
LPNSGKPEFGCHPRLEAMHGLKGVDTRHKAGQDEKEIVPRDC